MSESDAFESSIPAEARPVVEVIRTFGLREWAMLIAIMTGSVYAFHWIAGLLGWPVYLRTSASMVGGPHVGAGVAVLGLGMLVTGTVPTLLLGWLRIEAGLFAAAVGVGALASRGGTVGSLLRFTQRPQMY